TRFSRDWSSDVCSSDLQAGRPIPHAPVHTCTRVALDLCDQIVFLMPRQLLTHLAIAVDPGGYTWIGGRQHRTPVLDRAEDRTRHVQVENAGPPEPAVVGEIHEHIGGRAALLEFDELPAYEMRYDAFEADRGRKA